MILEDELQYRRFQELFRQNFLPEAEGIEFLLEAANLCRVHDPDFAAMLIVLAHSFSAIRHHLLQPGYDAPLN